MSRKTIDLRSDTVTKPTPAMRKAMAEAEVGDDVYGEDPTINRLEALASEMVGTEAAIFAPSGTQSNLLALLTHCRRGDEYIVGQEAHTYKYEGGGGAVFGSVQPQPIDFEPDGTIDLDRAAGVVKPDDFHFARTRLLCLENTQNGQALPIDYIKDAAAFTRVHNLKFHLDGARVFNASIKLKLPVTDITGPFDSISICLSKGLGAPVGSLLCSTDESIKKARRWRKVLGGGMRQGGILAAAGIIALMDHVNRLAEDHNNAALLASGLSEIDELRVDFPETQTNMVFISLKKERSVDLVQFLEKHGILVQGRGVIRLVTHLDVNDQDMEKVVETIKKFFSGGRK